MRQVLTVLLLSLIHIYKESYETLHPTGPKHNYAYHTEAMDRAMEGGIDDVGLGVLFGLEPVYYTHLDVYKRQ